MHFLYALLFARNFILVKKWVLHPGAGPTHAGLFLGEDAAGKLAATVSERVPARAVCHGAML
jgi:hypothetical protein